MDWEAYLTGKGVRGRHATGAEVAYPCFFDCDEPSDSRKRKLYVNSETGLYSCKVCVSEGNSITLMRHFGDSPERENVPGIGRRSEVLEEATKIGEKTLSNTDDVIEYLMGPRRRLNPETIIARRLGWASKQWPLTKQLPEDQHFKRADMLAAGVLAESQHEGGSDYEYYADRVLIPYIENGRVVQLRGKDIFGRYYTPIGDAVYLYNADSLKGATEAVIVEGEFDTMMLTDLLATSIDGRYQRMAVVGLAGTGALPADFAARTAHLKRIFIATDPDEAGRKAAQNLLDLIGDRAVVMAWPDRILNRAFLDGMELKDLDWTTWIGKYHVTIGEVENALRFKGRLVTLGDAMIRHLARPVTGLKLGLRNLDACLQPGLLPGQLMVVLAKTGVGKTLLLCNLAYNMRKHRILFITLEMTAEEIWVRLARIARFYNPWLSDDSVAMVYGNLRICDHNRLSEHDLQQLVEEYTDDVGDKPEVVFIDYLGYYARGRVGGTTYEKTSDAVMQLKGEAKRYMFSIIAPAQVNRGAVSGKPLDDSDARDSGVIEESADMLLGIWRSDDALDTQQNVTPSGKVHLKILKSRHGHKDRVFLLQMGLMSLVLVDDGGTDSDRARRETTAAFQGQTYEAWLMELRNYQPELGK